MSCSLVRLQEVLPVKLSSCHVCLLMFNNRFLEFKQHNVGAF